MALLLIKTVFISSVFYDYSKHAISEKAQFGEGATKPKLYGNYRVETFYKNTVVMPPLLTDKDRWNKIIFGEFELGAVQMMDDTLQAYTYHDNPDTNEIRFNDRVSDQLKYTFKYLQTDQDHIEMKSEDPDGSIYMKLVRLDPGDYLLIKRGFHWISEHPFKQ